MTSETIEAHNERVALDRIRRMTKPKALKKLDGVQAGIRLLDVRLETAGLVDYSDDLALISEHAVKPESDAQAGYLLARINRVATDALKMREEAADRIDRYLHGYDDAD